MENFLYHYKAIVAKVVDGDTIYCNVDLGFSTVHKMLVFRLANVNTPELKGDQRTAALNSKNFVIDKVLNKEVIILTKKDSKDRYGRYLATIFYQDNEDWICLNDLLIQKGLAEIYKD